MTIHQSPVNVFLSYVYKDEPLLRKLELHLSSLKRQGLISTWHHRRIVPGTNQAKVINEQLQQASIILLLVSADYLASDYCEQVEVERVLEREIAGDAYVVPIIIRSCDWKNSPFAHLAALPDTGKPLDEWRNRDAAFSNIVAGIRRVIEKLTYAAEQRAQTSQSEGWSVPQPGNPHFTEEVVISVHPTEPIHRLDGKPMPLMPAVFPGAASAPSVGSLVVAPMGLPLAASLIGRDDVLAELMTKLRAGSTNSIIALEGMGGVGKTALAAEAVAGLAEDLEAFPGGTAWIACEGLEGEAGLAELWGRVARAQGLDQVAAQPDPQRRRATLATALAQRQRLLLALDNIEPGLDAETVLETLSVRNHTALLLTARQRVSPHRVTAIDLAPLLLDGARTLFLERLMQVGGALPTVSEEPALAVLLKAVGGLPLALELTAAYAGVQRLKLASVVREVESDGLSALAFRDSKRALLKRFERSWVALSTYQQWLFAGLSLQAGASFSRMAARALAVTTAENTDPNEAETEDDLRADLPTLVSYALVEALPGGERLRLHPLLRKYAAKKLKALPPVLQERLGDVMVAYWLAYAKANPGFEGLDALEAEAAGLMGAMAWAHEHARHQDVLGLAHALSRFLFVRGRVDEARLVRPWALDAAIALDNKKEALWAAHELAMLDGRTKRLAEARAGFERALTLARQLGDLAEERAEVRELALLDQKTGQFTEARTGYELALALSKQLDDLAVERTSVHDLAVIHYLTGHLSEAQRGFEQALALARQLDDPNALAVGCSDFGLFLSQHGDQERAYVLINESLEISKRLNNVYRIGKCYQYLAALEDRQGKSANAITHYREALRCFEQVQAPEAEEVPADLRMLEADAEVVRVVRAFLDTGSRSETRALLEREQVLLLTDEADQLLSTLIRQVRQNANLESQKKRANLLTAYLLLLRKTRESDIPTAWAWFEQTLPIDD